MVFPYSVVQVGFIYELIPVNVIEKPCKTNEGRCGEECKNQSVACKKAAWVNSLNCLALSYFISIHVNKEVKNERVNDRVDFEVDTKPIENAT